MSEFEKLYVLVKKINDNGVLGGDVRKELCLGDFCDRMEG